MEVVIEGYFMEDFVNILLKSGYCVQIKKDTENKIKVIIEKEN